MPSSASPKMERVFRLKPTQFFTAVLALSLLAYVQPSKEADQVSTPDTPAGQIFASWLTTFNEGSRATILAFQTQHFPSQSSGPAHGHLIHEMACRRQTGGFHLKSIRDSDSTRLTAILKEDLSDQFASLQIEVNNTNPNQIVVLGIHPIPTPDEFLSRVEREAAIAARTLDSDRRRFIIDGVARELQNDYISPDAAERMIELLKSKAVNGDYDNITMADVFAETVTGDLQGVSHDHDILLLFGRQRSPMDIEDAVKRKEAMLAMHRRLNYGFDETEHLEPNVAHLTILEFIPSEEEEVSAAIADRMSEIADADVVLLDLRYNLGGSVETVALIASYFFDQEPVHLNHFPRSNGGGSMDESWTQPSVKGRKFGGKKPIFVLTSEWTRGGGEELAYDLQCLGRATIVGETTAGAAQTKRGHKLDDHFFFLVPSVRPVNPVTKTDWEGVGVVPDVVVSADNVFDEAYKLAQKELALRTEHSVEHGVE